MYLHYRLVFLPLLLVTYMRHAFYLKELLFRQLTERNFRRCDADLSWAVSPIGYSRQLEFCDPFRALSSYLCGTCYFLYAR